MVWFYRHEGHRDRRTSLVSVSDVGIAVGFAGHCGNIVSLREKEDISTDSWTHIPSPRPPPTPPPKKKREKEVGGL